MTAIDLFELIGWIAIVIWLLFAIAIPVTIVYLNRKSPLPPFSKGGRGKAAGGFWL